MFNGDPLGIIRAFDGDSGEILWSFNTGSSLRSGIVSYAVEGKQYILGPKRPWLVRHHIAAGAVSRNVRRAGCRDVDCIHA